MGNQKIIKEITGLLESNKLSGFRGDIGLTEGGPYVQRLEQSIRDYFKVKHAIAFNSATSALHAAVVALNEEEYIVTPFSFSSSASCVLQAGKKVKFQDIDPKTYCMTPVKGTSIPVHLFGGCADMDKFEGKIIEDAAQAIGSKYKGRYTGTIGDCGVFSFNQAKPISAGEGGVLVTNNDEIAHIAKLVRNHGEMVDPEKKIVGFNYRMTEIEAVISYHKFSELDIIIEKRKGNVEYFRERLGNINGVTPMWINPDVEYSWYVYAFEVKNNHKVAQKMTERGIPLRGGYITYPLNMLPIYEKQECVLCQAIWYNRIVVTDVIGKSKNEIDTFIKTLGEVVSAD
jgi:perosamine synthetase